MFTFAILVMLLFVSYRLPAQVFGLVTPSQSGIWFRNDIKESDSSNILVDFYMFNGGGVATGDIDEDGLLDIVFTSTQKGLAFYKNEGSWKFTDRTRESGLILPDTSQNTGVLIADLNTDGLLDVYVSRRYAKNRVFINQGRGEFRDETDISPLGIHAYTTQAVQIDYDRDGDLDLMLINSGEPRRKGYINPGVSDILMRNDGQGRYTDVSQTAGITDKGYGLSASVGDLDEDGWPDVYVANDFEERDKIWLNQRNGIFEEVASRRLSNMSWASMGSDIADINADGLLDVVTVDMLPRDNYRRQTQLGGMSIYGPFFDSLQRVQNTLQLNRGSGQFINIAHMAGISATDWSWSVLAQDYDLDTDVDLLITNGTKRDLGDQDFAYNFLSNPRSYQTDAYKSMPSTRLPNCYFTNRGGAGNHLLFDEQSALSGLSDSIISNGAAFADLDNDGDMDVVINNTDTVAFVYQNQSIEQGNKRWSGLVLRDGTRNVNGIGSRITWSISSPTAQRTIVQECYAVRGFQSASDPRLVVALGPTEKVDSIMVRWPNGTSTVVRSVASMAYTKISLAETNPASQATGDADQARAVKPLYVRMPDTLLPYRHRENSYDDFKRERLLPYRFSKDGPAMAVGDVNGDKIPDLITAGAKYQPTQCFLQLPNGTFEPFDAGLADAVESEDIDLVLVDIDNDKDLDLVVVTGGSEFEPDDVELHDRVYRNNGKGVFARLPEELATTVAGSCVVSADMDRDGDNDLFIGGRVVPGRFPELAPSALYANVKGHFVDVTDSLAPGLRFAGMTSSALWVDIDNDNDQDLVVVGEWMAPRVWRNTKGRFAEATTELGLDSLLGWWAVVRAADVDGDGDQDLLLGNNGTNCQFAPLPSSPIECFAADYDDNGSLDPLVFRYVEGKLVPTRGRSTITSHMPTLTRKFTTYAAFAEATINDILTKEQQAASTHLVVKTFHSGILRNNGGAFTFEPFPDIAQAAPIKDMLADDVDGDGDVDIIAIGNTRTADGDNIGYDGGIGVVLKNTGAGRFTPMPASESGLAIHRECRRIVRIPRQAGKPLIAITTNSSTPVLLGTPVE
jgi:hypothetical protein